jgi:hypothetical protein
VPRSHPDWNLNLAHHGFTYSALPILFWQTQKNWYPGRPFVFHHCIWDCFEWRYLESTVVTILARSKPSVGWMDWQSWIAHFISRTFLANTYREASIDNKLVDENVETLDLSVLWNASTHVLVQLTQTVWGCRMRICIRVQCRVFLFYWMMVRTGFRIIPHQGWL